MAGPVHGFALLSAEDPVLLSETVFPESEPLQHTLFQLLTPRSDIPRSNPLHLPPCSAHRHLYAMKPGQSVLAGPVFHPLVRRLRPSAFQETSHTFPAPRQVRTVLCACHRIYSRSFFRMPILPVRQKSSAPLTRNTCEPRLLDSSISRSLWRRSVRSDRALPCHPAASNTSCRNSARTLWAFGRRLCAKSYQQYSADRIS